MNNKKYIFSIVIAMILLALSISTVSAADVHSFTDLQTMVDNTPTNDVLNLNGTTFNQFLGGNTIHINKNIQINGASKDNSSLISTIDGNGKAGIFTISDGVSVSFMNILFINGKADYGGSIYGGYNCNVKIDSCTFTSNTGNRQGGGVYVNNNSQLSITNSTFSNNQADKGGSVYGAKNTDLKINNTVFSLSKAKNGGGAIFIDENSGLNIFNCHFINTIAEVDGGGICGRGNVIITRCNFTNTIANKGSGGAIFVQGTISVINSRFTNTTANSGSGGAIFGYGTISVLYSTFTDTSVKSEGGAIYGKSRITVTNSTFRNTISISGDGGAIYNNNGGVFITDSTFKESTAGNDGGGIYGKSGIITITDSIFIHTTANTGSGGGIYSESGSVTVTKSAFTTTTANSGSGGAIFGYGTISVINSIFTDTSVKSEGGAIYGKSRITVTNSIFIKNTGSGGSYGGAICGKSNVIVTNSTFNDAQSFSDLEKELNNVNNGDTLYLNGRNFIVGETITINKNITINGASKDNSSLVTTINCDGKYNGFSIGDNVSVSFINILFINGKSDYGGAIYGGYNCNVRIVNCNFTSNTGNRQGGAVYVNNNSYLSISNCVFSANVADKGGALYVAKNTDLKIDNSQFYLNRGKDKGGVIFIDKNTGLSIDNCVFNHNAATEACVIYNNSDCNIIVRESYFNNNTESIDFEVFQSKIDNANTGDTIYLDGKIYIIRGPLIINQNITINGASKDNPNLVTTIDCNGRSNGFKISDGVSVTFMNIHFINGKADYGGAIYGGCKCNVRIVNCNFTSNAANKDGGAVYVNNNSCLSVINCIFSVNTAAYGGAIYCAKNTDLKIEDSKFSLNIAEYNGGAIYIDKNSTINVNNCSFDFNVATNGGALYSSDDCKGIVKTSDFNNNGCTPKSKNILIAAYIASIVPCMIMGAAMGAIIGAETIPLVGAIIGAAIGAVVGAIFGGVIFWKSWNSDNSKGNVLLSSENIEFTDCQVDGKNKGGKFTIID